MKTIPAILVILFLVFGAVLTTGAFQQPSTSLAAQADNKAADDDRPLYHFGIPPYQKGQRIDAIRGLYLLYA